MKIGVKFCGNCNPRYDTPALLKALMTRAEEMAFMGWEDGAFDVLLILSACSSDCATRPPFAGPVVVATGETVDRWPVDAGELADEILIALRRYGTG